MSIEEIIANNLRYCPESGEIHWITEKRRGGLKAGRRAKGLDAHGYLQINIGGRVLKGHRIAWFLHHGEWPSGQIDHLNQIKTDNRIANMRDTTAKENGRNHPRQSNNKTGVAGVCVHKKSGRFRATIYVSGRQIHLGYFDALGDAADARRDALRIHGFAEAHGK